MSDQPTPETDAAIFKVYEGPQFSPTVSMVVDSAVSRKLELERDQARELARELRDALGKASVSYTYSDEWRNDARQALTKAKEVLP
jgi:hypothetical protein